MRRVSPQVPAQQEKDMIRPLPEPVAQAWGDEAATAFMDWWTDAMSGTAVGREEFARLESRFDRLEDRLDTLDRDVGEVKADVRSLRTEMNERFDRLRTDIDSRLDAVNGRLDAVNERLEALNERLASQMRWSAGLLAVFGTLVALLLALGQYGP